jgi:type IV secretion system protein VirB8
MNAAVDRFREPGRISAVEQMERTRADAVRAANLGWETDRIVEAERSKRVAWKVAAAAIGVAVLAVAAVFVQGPLRIVEPVPIVVDRLTGETSVGYRLEADTIPPVEALDMHNAARFVRSREGYNWSFLQKEYDTVARMATPDVFTEYNRQFEGDNSLDKRFGASGEVRVNVLLIRLPPGGRLGNAGEATVTFEKVMRAPNQPAPEIKRYVATLRYEYRPNLLAKQQDRLENPFGFVVTAYRADLEMIDAAAASK